MMRAIWTVVLLSLAAPSMTFAAQGRVVDRSPEYWRSYAEGLPIGATVNVRTVDGKRVKAILAIVGADGITVDVGKGSPRTARHIPYQDLVQLELAGNGGGIAKAMAIGAGIGAGTLIGFLLILGAATN